MVDFDEGPKRNEEAEMQEDFIWLSTRKIRRAGEPEWDNYSKFVGQPHWEEVRTIDNWCNPCLDGNYAQDSIEGVWEFLEEGILKAPENDDEYHLLFVDAEGEHHPLLHPRLHLLGYDLSDETWTSSLLNCGRWMGPLEAIARRTKSNGLLNFEDAVEAKRILPEAWNGDPHANLTIWALYEIVAGELPQDDS
jgi:hypothetical protein